MKFPLVSRKKYEIWQNNYKLCNEHRIKTAAENAAYQFKITEQENIIRELKKEIKTLKAKNTKLTKKVEE